MRFLLCVTALLLVLCSCAWSGVSASLVTTHSNALEATQIADKQAETVVQPFGANKKKDKRGNGGSTKPITPGPAKGKGGDTAAKGKAPANGKKKPAKSNGIRQGRDVEEIAGFYGITLPATSKAKPLSSLLVKKGQKNKDGASPVAGKDKGKDKGANKTGGKNGSNFGNSPAKKNNRFLKNKFQQLQAENAVEAHSQSAVSAPTLPATLIFPIQNLAVARNTIRGAPDITFPGFNLYSTNARNGVVLSVNAIVAVSRGKHRVGDPAVLISDVMYNSTVATSPGMVGARPRTVYNSGHIIAGSLGGNDNDPLNFFPQRSSSNQIGRWHRIEKIAQALWCAFDAFGIQNYTDAANNVIRCSVIINPQFVYPFRDPPFNTPTGNPFMPSGGTYTVRVPSTCLTQLTAVSTPTTRDAYAQAFVRHARQTSIVQGGVTIQMHQLQTPWRNTDEYVVAAPQTPPAARDVVQPNLFA